MLKIFSALLFVFSVTPCFSSELKPMEIADIEALDPADIQQADPSKAAYQHVWMTVRNNPSWKEAEANDWGARIETRVRETFKDSYDVSMRADSNSNWASIRKSGSFYTMSGAGIYLNMSGSNGSYFLNGNISENGKSVHVSVNVSRRFDDYSFSVFGAGINLYTDRNSINGNYDSDKFSKKAVASVTSMILALQAEKGEPKETKAANLSQRIWLTIGPGFGGWNEVEARDPWARIEVGLRKVFDREYDVEIEVDNGHKWGRVSNFFARRYELRAGKTDLQMEEWAGQWEIKGEVEVNLPGQEGKGIKLQMRERFGDGSFYIVENGIRLYIDRNSISGDVDTKMYPKEVVASITALVMAYQQVNQPQKPE